jgi:excisionase family DNA binding protein
MSSNSEWVSLRHAADILGVHPATVRNWADKGDLPTRRTPGGHRRFRRADLLRLAETYQEDAHQPTNEVRLILQNALGQARMQKGQLDDTPWYQAMSEGTRQTMREQGRAVLEAMRGYLANGNSEANLVAAVKLGHDYAQSLHNDGMTLPDAMRGFFYFTEFVMDSVLSWSEVTAPRDHHDWARLLRQVNQFNNTMLLSIVEYYEED